MNLREFLNRHDLVEWAEIFEREHIDLVTLSELSDAELHGLGLPLGARKKLQRAIRGGSSTAASGTGAGVFAGSGEQDSLLGAATMVGHAPLPAGGLPEAIDGYPVESILGQGGMGAVFRVQDKHTGHALALKTMKVEMLGGEAQRARFRQEYGLLQRLTHPGIIRVFGMGEDPQWGLYYTMELIGGGTLSRWAETQGGDPHSSYALWQQIAAAVAAAHAAGVVHRDLKPANILLRPDGQPVVGDWGLGGASQQARSRTQALGTSGWAPPEQAEGLTGPFTDVYGLGGLLAWLFTDLPPREATGRLAGLLAPLGSPWSEAASVLEAALAGRRFRTATVAALHKGIADALTALPNWAPQWANRVGEDQFGRWAEFTVDGVAQRMRWIKPGSFLMGSPAEEQEWALSWMKKAFPDQADESWVSGETQHRVTLTQGYWLADTPCIQGLWQAVMGENPSAFHDDPLRPVEQVSWDDCQLFFEKLPTVVPGLTVCFPTEAQWEYACRAGTTTATYAGALRIDGICNAPILDGIAWYGGNSGMNLPQGALGFDSSDWPEKQCDHQHAGTHRVGEKRPNAWGLYDLIGNVNEWCADWYEPYKEAAVTDPSGPGSGSTRVNRGGSWIHYAAYCRAAYRGRNVPGNRCSNLGFRLCAPGQ